MEHSYSFASAAAIGVFAIVYLWFLLHQILCERIELYDFIVLSTVAAVPVLFVAFPNEIENLSREMGIGIPFLFLYGILFAVAYYFLTRLAMLIHHQRKMLRRVTQELALAKLEASKLAASEKDMGAHE